MQRSPRPPSSRPGWSAGQLATLNGTLDCFHSFGTHTLGNAAATLPYHHRHGPEVTVNPDGTGLPTLV